LDRLKGVSSFHITKLTCQESKRWTWKT
jgi:hypothetical protein